jgi:hypothetical protein
MLDPVLDHKPRGFQGRPLIALLFAVGLGISASYLGSWMHLNKIVDKIVEFVSIVAVVAVIGYMWRAK